jgi:glucokinase
VILAADIGGTKIAVGTVDPDCQRVADLELYPTPSHDGDDAVAVVGAALARRRTSGCLAVAISAAGVIDSTTGRVLSATSSLTGWAGRPLGDELAEIVGLPVFVLGDGNCFGLGLAAAYGVSDLVALVVGTGIGGSVVVDGFPVLGAGHAAGHLGHMPVAAALGLPCPCGGTGHLEAIASGAAILAAYRRSGGDPSVPSTRELAARTDDAIAGQVFQTAGAALGEVAAGVVSAVHPQLVVVAGSVTAAGTPWASSLRTAYSQALMPALRDTPLVLSTAGPVIALCGAARYALRRLAA